MPPALADSLKTRATTLGVSVLKGYSQWYHKGTFRNSWGPQWVYNTSGAASLCAALYRSSGFTDNKYNNVCIESWNYAIDNLMPGGWFSDEAGAGSTGLECFVFGAHLAWTMFLLENHLDPVLRQKWLAALKGNIDHTEQTGDLLWFANGNWVANQVRMLFLTKEVCRQMGDAAGYAKYNALYERNYSFLIDPSTVPTPTAPNGDPKWVGYGLIVETPGGWADKSDEISHITEFAGGPPVPNGGLGTSSDGIAPFGSYDGDYTGLTLEHLSQWFVASRDYRALKLLNGSINKYMSTVNTTTWVGDFSHGSRHNNPANGIFTPALAVLALLGERQITGSLAAPFTDVKVLDEWDHYVISALGGFPGGNVPYAILRSWGNVIGTVLYACEQAQIKL